MGRQGRPEHLTGRIVTLRPFAESDIAPAYLGWLNDPAVTRYSNQRFRTHSVETCRAYLRSFQDTDNLFLAIYRNADFVGTMTAYVSTMHRTADMGILLGAQSQGRGLGTDAWVTLMAHLLREGTRKVTGGALRCNSAMVKIMLNSGMAPDGVRIAHELVDGVAHDILHFAKFNS